jgi:putative heme-binding domain-containing protein
LKRSGKSLRSTVASQGVIDGVLRQAAKTANDRDASISDRKSAVLLMAYDEFPQIREDVARLLEPGEPQDVQRAAVAVLAGFNDADVAPLLLQHWRTFTPAVREDVVSAMLAVRTRALPLLQAVDAGDIPASQIPFAQRRLLIASTVPQVKELANKFYGSATNSPRKAVIEQYQKVLATTGDVTRGRAVFERACMNCHRLGDQGTKDVGPNLATVRAWNAEQLLINILDPSREVAPAYLGYSLATTNGRVLFGLIVDDGPNSVTVKRPDGTTETVLRRDIDELAGTGTSVMPENLETLVTSENMVDLIAFLKNPPPTAAAKP